MIQNEGRYKARASGEVVVGESKNKGTPFIEFYFEILDGEDRGKKVRWTSYFTDKTQERTVEALITCGWKGDDVGEFADKRLHGLDSNEVEIVTELEEYTNDKGEKKTAPRVKWVNKLGGYLNVQNAMTPDAAASFGDRLKGLVHKVREKKGESADGADFNFGANEKPAATGTPARKSW